VLRPMAADPPATRRERIWSAGCSSAEEPSSNAKTVLEAVEDLPRWDIRILATDLDSDMLTRARTGVYPAERMRGIDPQRLARFFREGRDAGGPAYHVVPELATLITFKQLNLMHPLPMKGPLDVIFCRNTVIYFDRDTQRDLFSRVARLQRPGATLLLGHSESLFQVSSDYTLIGKTVYRRN
ncbi:MAG: CheR family methyltransferase, partial [Steroidobacteraceae bacterium]